MRLLLLIFIPIFFGACKYSVNPPGNPLKKVQKTPLDVPLNSLNLPDGFKIEVYSNDIENARSLALAPTGTLFVGTRSLGEVYALQDLDKDFVTEKKHIIMKDGNMPNGVAVKDNDLYVAEVNRILKFPDVENNLEIAVDPEIIYDQYPTEKHHGWKYIAFGPDDHLYVPVGAPCNICESEDPIFNTITRLNVENKEMEIMHSGIRNTVGFSWHPETQDLWFSDNGRDMMGDDMPGCELNYANKNEMHFGYPYCHQGDTIDPKLGEGKSCDDYTAPAQILGPHTAPLGIEFYKKGMFPESYSNAVFIAEHGSWNRSKKIGYRITMVRIDENNNSLGYETFIDGWLDESNDDVWGRPVDLEWLPDGSLLISDDFANLIYRVTYES